MDEKQYRILIVDDDPAYAKMIKAWIKDIYRVDVVTAGAQAITFLGRLPGDKKVDMILLDYEMPVMNGPQVFKLLKEEPVTKDIPVIFLTGAGNEEALSLIKSLEPKGYISKTSTRDELLEYLGERLEG